MGGASELISAFVVIGPEVDAQWRWKAPVFSPRTSSGPVGSCGTNHSPSRTRTVTGFCPVIFSLQSVKILSYREPQNQEYQQFVRELKTDAQTSFNYSVQDSLVRRRGLW